VTRLRKAMLEELQRRNLSRITTRIYLHSVEEFARYYNASPDRLGPEQIREYQAHLFTDRKLGAIAVGQQLSALRFFFVHTLKRPWMTEHLVVPKRPFRLPEVLSREEVERLIQSASSPLHRIWLLILYATGLRREELVRLKIADIDRGRMVIHIRQGKGRKDRDVMLSPRLLQELRDYWRSANPRPKTYLFPGKGRHAHVDVPMTSKSVWDAAQQAATRAGLDKGVHPHTLRHCFATIYSNPAQICARFNSCSAIPIRRRPAVICTCRSGISMLLRAPSIHLRWHPRTREKHSPQEVNGTATPGVGRDHSRRRSTIHGPATGLVRMAASQSSRSHSAVPHRRDGRPYGSVPQLRPSRHLV
jgi:integrase/recombinase XerD